MNEIESSKKFSKTIIKNNVYKNLIQNKTLSPNNENADITIDSKINNNLDNKNSPPIKKTRSQLNINEASNVGSFSNNNILFYERNRHIRKSNIRKSQISSNELSKITGTVPPYEILNFFQNCSTEQSESIGKGVKFMLGLNKAWVLIGYKLIINRPVKYEENIIVGTEPTDFKGFFGRRNYCIMDENENFIVKADSLWTLIDLDREAHFE